jgi:hypothetical protein
MPSKEFNPNRARLIGSSGEVENLDFRETAAQAGVINSLICLSEDLKGTNSTDFNLIFRGQPKSTINRFRRLSEQIVRELERIENEPE